MKCSIPADCYGAGEKRKKVSTFLNRIRSTMSVLALLAFLNSEFAWGYRLERLTPGQLPAPANPPEPGTPAQQPGEKPAAPESSPQQPAPKGDQTVVQVPLPTESDLEITVVEGEDGSNVVGKTSSSRPLVTVRDAKKQPVEGVVVTFIAPADGPSVVFGNGLRSVTVLTDADGKAQVPRMKAVNEGSFKLQVSASYHGQIVNAAISQTNYEAGNAPPASKGPAKNKGGLSGGMLAVIIGGGAAAAIGIGLGLGHKGSSTSTTTTTTSATIGAPGTPTAGPP
jgi:hypothetical protein